MDEFVEKVVAFERGQGMVCGPWEQHWLLSRKAPESVRRYLRLAKEQPFLFMTRQGFQAMDVNDVNTAAFTARNNLAAATEGALLADTASSAPPQSIINQYCAIPANDPRAGKVYQVECTGIYSNTGTPTITWTPRWGTSTTIGTNVSLGASSAWTSITSTTNLPFYLYLTVAVRTAPPGATQGTVYATGYAKMGMPVTSSNFMADIYYGGGTGATTVDTSGQGTAGVGLQFGIAWSAQSASNTIQPMIWILRSLN